MFNRMTRLMVAIVVMAAAACTHIYRNHGYIPPAEDLAMVQVGQTTRDELPGLIGIPSAQGLLSGSGWYYVSSRWDHFGAREPREIAREVVAVSFADNGVVSNIERFGLEDGRVVVLSRRVTDSNVAGIGLIRQLLGNIGNFNPGQLLK